MKKVYVFLADGFEDVEALIPVDVWRRGGIKVTTVSITDFPLVQSAHGVNIEADVMFEQCDFTDADLLFLPGGMPGSSNLFAHKGLCKALVDHFAAGKKIAAICAAPAVVLAPLGILDGKRATCYPGMEQPLADASAIAFSIGCLETAKHTKLCYSGEGSDEFFGGYNMYRNAPRYGDNLKNFYVGNTNIMKEDEKERILLRYDPANLPINLVKDIYEET